MNTKRRGKRTGIEKPEWIPVERHKPYIQSAIETPSGLYDFIQDHFLLEEITINLTGDPSREFSEEDHQRVYNRGLGYAVELKKANPSLPNIPRAVKAPEQSLRELQQWCLAARVLWVKQELAGLDYEILQGCGRLKPGQSFECLYDEVRHDPKTVRKGIRHLDKLQLVQYKKGKSVTLTDFGREFLSDF